MAALALFQSSLPTFSAVFTASVYFVSVNAAVIPQTEAIPAILDTRTNDDDQAPIESILETRQSSSSPFTSGSSYSVPTLPVFV
jgi:hypothetical protein